MAATLVQHKVADTTANGTTVAVTVTSIGTGRLIIVGGANVNSRTITGVTDNASGGSNTYIQATNAAAFSTVGTLTSDIWYCLSTIRGSITTVTIQFSGSNGTDNRDGWVFEVSGFTTCVFDLANHVNNQTTASSTDTGAAVVTTSTTGFVVGVCATNWVITANPKAGNEFTAGGDIAANTTNAACSLISATAASHTPAWTDTTNKKYCASTAAFKEASGTAYSQTCTETVTMTDVLVKNPNKKQLETLVLTDVFSRSLVSSRLLADSVVLSDVLFKTPVKTLVLETITINDILSAIQSAVRTFVETITINDTFSRSLVTSRVLTETITLTDVLSKIIIKGLIETIILTDSIFKSIIRTLMDSIIINDVLLKSPFKYLTESITLSDVLTKIIIKGLNENLTITDIFSRILIASRTFTETIILSDSGSVFKTLYQIFLNEVISLTDTISVITTITTTISNWVSGHRHFTRKV